MLKRWGLTIVACGLIVGMSCFADAAVVTSKVTTHNRPKAVAVKTHGPAMRKGFHRARIRRVSQNTVSATTTNTVAGRYRRMHFGVRHHRVWMS